MPFPLLHLGNKTRDALSLSLCLAVLTGCQSLSSTGSSAKIRVIDVSPDAPAMDVYQGNSALAYNLTFGTVTSYLPMTPGSSNITVDLAGSRQVLSSVEGAFTADAHYTVLVSSALTNLQQTILTDRDPLPAIKGPASPSIRFIHQAIRTGAVDVYLVPAGQRLASVTPVVTNLVPGANTGYLSVPACTCTAVMLPTGTSPSAAATAVHNGAQSTYLTGSARTVILLDATPSASSSVQVISTPDAEPFL